MSSGVGLVKVTANSITGQAGLAGVALTGDIK